MARVVDWLKHGWHVLKGLHTAVWLFGLIGVSASSLIRWAPRLSKPEYLAGVILAQTLIWLVVVALAAGYVGYRARKFEAVPKIPVGIGGAGGSVKVLGKMPLRSVARR